MSAGAPILKRSPRNPANDRDPYWRERATCAEEGCDPQDWETVPAQRSEDRPGALECRHCPVRVACGLDAWHTTFDGTIRAGFGDRWKLRTWLVGVGAVSE